MHELLNLYITQKKREFRWKDVFIFIYFAFVLSLIGFLVYQENGEQINRMIKNIEFENFIVLIAAGCILPDFITKLIFKHDVTLMDDYLKTKPISDTAWNRFIALTNTLNFWNILLPILSLIVCLWLMPVAFAILSFIMIYSMSYLNGLAVTSLRKADGWECKMPIWIGWVVYLIFSSLLSFLLIGLTPVAQILIDTVFNAVCICCMYLYMCKLKRYNEYKTTVSHAKSISSGSLLGINFMSLLRGKRLMTPVILMTIVCLLQVYANYREQDKDWICVIYYFFIFFIICYPSVLVGQTGFGVEANYFDGIMTKPYAINDLLRNKYYSLIILDLICSLFLIPLLFMRANTLLIFVSTLIFASGFINLIMLPMCLYTKRFEISDSSFFNFQGTHFSLYWYLIVLPLFMFYVFAFAFFSSFIVEISVTSLGLLSFAFHKLFINKLSKIFIRRRYDIMENMY
jgi:hypothetical protein